MAKNKATFVTSAKVTLTYPNLLEPASQQGEESKRKYSVRLVIDPADTVTMGNYKKAVAELMSKEGEAFKKASAKNLPMKNADEYTRLDGATASEHEPFLKGKFFMNASSGENYPPDVRVLKNGQRLPATKEDLYSGMQGAVCVDLVSYEHAASHKKGVTAILRSVLKCYDGDRFTLRANADSDFSNLEIPADAGCSSATADQQAADDDDIAF